MKINVAVMERKESSLLDEDQSLLLARKYAYGVGGVPMQLTTSAISFYLSLFLLEIAQMPPYHLFYVILIGRLWDAVTDPVAGYIVAKTNTRWGHFKPFMVGSIPFLCFSFVGLFYDPGIKAEGPKLLYFLFVMVIFQTSITFYFIPYGSMSMVLTTDNKERDQLTAYSNYILQNDCKIDISLFLVSLNRNKFRNYRITHRKCLFRYGYGFV